MPYKNPTEILADATKFPAAIEAKLPEGAPKISTMLADVAGKLPKVPNLPMEIPDLPAPPELPEMPEVPGLKYVTGVEVKPVGAPVTPVARAAVTAVPEGRREIIPSPAVGVIPEVITRRGI